MKKLTETQKPELTFALESDLRAAGYRAVCGVDEAGRGPLCGPVYAAAVILPEGFSLNGINDSKQLTPKMRDELFPEIIGGALAYGIGHASVAEIEETNILEAALLAMRRAVAECADMLPPDYLLVDGNIFRDFDTDGRCVVKGDAISPSIAAASILAKVSRDRVMEEYDVIYPGYGFAKHKGYGTKDHYAAIDKLGITPIHRKKFLEKYFAKHGKQEG